MPDFSTNAPADIPPDMNNSSAWASAARPSRQLGAVSVSGLSPTTPVELPGRLMWHTVGAALSAYIISGLYGRSILPPTL